MEPRRAEGRLLHWEVNGTDGDLVVTGPVGHSVAQAYAGILQELQSGDAVVPTFADAVRRHRMLDDVRAASATGRAVVAG